MVTITDSKNDRIFHLCECNAYTHRVQHTRRNQSRHDAQATSQGGSCGGPPGPRSPDYTDTLCYFSSYFFRHSRRTVHVSIWLSGQGLKHPTCQRHGLRRACACSCVNSTSPLVERHGRVHSRARGGAASFRRAAPCDEIVSPLTTISSPRLKEQTSLRLVTVGAASPCAPTTTLPPFACSAGPA